MMGCNAFRCVFSAALLACFFSGVASHGEAEAFSLYQRKMAVKRQYERFEILISAPVLRELKVSELQKQNLVRVYAGLQRELKVGRQQATYQGVLDEEAFVAYAERMHSVSWMEMETFLSPDQLQRYAQSCIQKAGIEAILEPSLQAALGLSEAQKAKVTQIESARFRLERALADKRRKAQLSARSFHEASQQVEQSMRDSLWSVLTPGQLEKLKSLGGSPLE